jgi:hypothetical protein
VYRFVVVSPIEPVNRFDCQQERKSIFSNVESGTGHERDARLILLAIEERLVVFAIPKQCLKEN